MIRPSRPDARSRTRTRRVAIALGAAMLLAGGCAPDSVAPLPDTDVSRLFWHLTLDQHALNLSTDAPTDTVRIVATPRGPDGAPLAGVAAPTWRSTNPTRAQVDSQGLVRAIAAGDGTLIIATLRVGNILHADTAFVRVTAGPAPAVPTALSIQPLPGDSAVWEANKLEVFGPFFGSRPIVAHDGDGVPVEGLLLHFTSSDTSIATIDRSLGLLDGYRPGIVTLTATTTAYGRVLRDSVRFTVTMPVIQLVLVATEPPGSSTLAFSPATVTIAQGGSIAWFNLNRAEMAITFDDSTRVAEDQILCWCGSGNIPLFGNDTLNVDNNLRGRSFPEPGTYVYRTTLYGGATGRVIVAPKPVDSTTVATAALRPAVAAGHR